MVNRSCACDVAKLLKVTLSDCRFHRCENKLYPLGVEIFDLNLIQHVREHSLKREIIEEINFSIDLHLKKKRQKQIFVFLSIDSTTYNKSTEENTE